MSNIILPRLERLEFHGFEPLFDEPVRIDLPTGPFLILGGNGLGKTTILQSTIYALAGIADEQVEEENSEHRWNLAYFHKRFNANAKSEVIVTFSLAMSLVSVRRDFKTSSIRGLKINESDWINDTKEATEGYEKVVREEGGYSDFQDFRYVVHRLCYLAENRRNLLWDQRAQVRAIMLICSDSATEKKFREIGKELKLADSDMRHRHVDIGHIISKIAQLELPNTATATVNSLVSQEIKAKDQADKLHKELIQAVNKRAKLLSEQRRLYIDLKKQNEAVEILQERVSKAEDRQVLKTLQDLESQNEVLALNKLLTYHKCPYCSQTAAILAARAKINVAHGDCPICEQSYISLPDTKTVDELRASLATETAKRSALDKQALELEYAYSEQINLEADIRSKLDKHVEKLPRIPKDEIIAHGITDIQSLKRILTQYEADYGRLQSKVLRLREELNASFTSFTTGRATSLNQLRKIASEYGTSFLGDPCEFVACPVKGNETLTYFVPRFADEERRTPTACSESERFFLDIAFRMAIIDLSSQLTGYQSTFICETPENALDLAYTDNVAEMFNNFCKKNFSLLLTANIQQGGVALPILKKTRKSDRSQRIFNMIQRGNLTGVQAKNRARFERELKAILGS